MTAVFSNKEGKLWAETDEIACAFSWPDEKGKLSSRPGVTELRIKNTAFWPVRQLVPMGGIWLWPEYYMRKGYGERGAIDDPDPGITVEHSAEEVIYRYPAEPQWQIDMEVKYRVHKNMIDSFYVMVSSKEHVDFELFMASYVDSSLGETWVQARGCANDRNGWVLVENRRHLWGVWVVLADAGAAARFFDGRWAFIQRWPRAIEHSFLAYYTLERPIMMARSLLTGAAAVFLGDPKQTTLVAGQYHERDTAHDFGFFGRTLTPGKRAEARVRTIIVPGTQRWSPDKDPELNPLLELIDREWNAWITELKNT